MRYYIAQGLLPPPTSTGRDARYGDEHLARLREIKNLQAEHLPLAEIRATLSTAGGDGPRAYSRPPKADQARVGESAVDYVHQVLVGSVPVELAAPPSFARSIGFAPSARLALAATPQPALPSQPSPPPKAAAFDAPDETLPEPPGELSRSQWDRLSLDPDIELHIRRPLSRPLNKKVERLVAIARQLLEEDQP